VGKREFSPPEKRARDTKNGVFVAEARGGGGLDFGGRRGAPLGVRALKDAGGTDEREKKGGKLRSSFTTACEKAGRRP